jgi:sulfoxide reductase heme-binding subunit YedZ
VNAIDWYAARSAGVVAYCLLTGGVLLGVLLAGRARLPRWPQFAVADVHRYVAFVTGAFVVLHVYTLLLDRYVHTSLLAMLVPGASSYRPFWVALGTVALELLAAIGVSNLFRKRLGHARWRRIHYLTFAVWAAATAHGVGAGTDSGADWLRLLYVVSIGSVAAAVVWRAGRAAAGAPARS